MSNRLFVGNLSFEVDDNRLRAVFAQIGPVMRAEVVWDKPDGRPRGFGFVDMENAADAQRAIAELNGKEIEGRPIRVELANSIRRGAPRGGGSSRRSG